MEPKVIYENEHLLVLDKPAGWLTHADGRTGGPTVTAWLLEHYPALAAVGEPMRLANGSIAVRPGIVHRLDRGTSGALAVAKDETTYRALRQAFADRLVKKSYRLLVHGVVQAAAGTINAAIVRSRRDPRQRAAVARPRGRSLVRGRARAALTRYRVLRRFSDATYLEAYPETGRTHQLRVHFKSIQHPLVGDQLYARSSPAIISRIALHAYCLELPPAIAPAAAILIAPLPLDFFTALALLGEL